MMSSQSFIIILVAFVLTELLTDLIKKTPLWLVSQLVAPYQRFWRQLSFLRSEILTKDKFERWNPKKENFVALSAIKALKEGGIKNLSVIQIIQTSVSDKTPLILLGDPGSGKTTVLEAITYRLARKAYFLKISLWLSILFFAVLFLWAGLPWVALVILLSYTILESFLFKIPIPVYFEIRSEYLTRTEIDGWLDRYIAKYLGGKPLFRYEDHFIFLIDGTNELSEDQFSIFIEGWRSLLRKNKYPFAIVFTSRRGENPSPRLDIDNVYTVCPLDDCGVRDYLVVYGKQKAIKQKEIFDGEKIEDVFNELCDKGLLDERGIARNPYWLKLIIESDWYSANKGALFHKFVKALLDHENEEKPEERKKNPYWVAVPTDTEMVLLGQLAAAMHQNKTIGLIGRSNIEKGQRVITEGIQGRRYSYEDVLFEAHSAMLLSLNIEKSYFFSHQLVQEFFVAYSLYDKECWSFLLSQGNDRWWWQTIFLTGGLVEYLISPDAFTEFVEQVLYGSREDSRLFVAIGLLQSVDAPPVELSEQVVNQFIASVETPLSEDQIAGAQGLVNILRGTAIKSFVQILHNPDPRIAQRGACLLCSVKSREAREALLAESNPAIIQIIGSAGKPALDILYAKTLDPSPEVRQAGINALYSTGEPGIQLLFNISKSKDQDTAYWAAQALARNGTLAVRFILGTLPLPDIAVNIDSLIKQNEETFATLDVIARMNKKLFIRELSHPDPKHRFYAVIIVGHEKVGLAVDDLLSLAISDEDGKVKWAAEKSLTKIGREVLDRISSHLSDYTTITNSQKRILLRIYQDINASLPNPEPPANFDQGDVNLRAHMLQEYMDTWRKMNFLKKYRGKSSRIGIEVTLEKDRAHKITAKPDFIEKSKYIHFFKGLGDQNPRARERALNRLVCLGPEVIPGLVEVLYTGTDEAKKDAISALREIGEPSVIPELKRIHDETGNMDIRVAAQLAMNRITLIHDRKSFF